MSTSPLTLLLATFEDAAKTEREKGTYFEELTLQYLRHEPYYAGVYKAVWTFGDWATQAGLDANDAGTELVANRRQSQGRQPGQAHHGLRYR